jgi:bifunctional DNA-binding transcriptional regulator/antitoxin component of YhaV-PrlF toxin-antitoxin module
MAQKGMEIGEKTVTLRRSTTVENSQNVYNMVKLKDFDVSNNEKIYVEIFESHGGAGYGTSWVAKVYESQKRITLPKSVIENGNLRPGDVVDFVFYRLGEQQDGKDENVIDTCTAVVDKSKEDNVKHYLNSKKVCVYFNSHNGYPTVELENKRNGKTTEFCPSNVESNENEGHYYFNFPKETRKSLETTPGDEIAVKKVDGRDTTYDNGKIEEIHSMVSEMYDAYLESKND